MAKLTQKKRRKLPKSKVGYVTKSKNKKTGKVTKKVHFPVNDKTHAEKALQFIDDAPPSKRPRIRRLANKELYGVNSSEKDLGEKIRKKKMKKNKKSK